MNKIKSLISASGIIVGASLLTTPGFATTSNAVNFTAAPVEKIASHQLVTHNVKKDEAKLHRLGFSDQEIKDMGDDEYLKYFANQDGKLVSKVTKYYKVMQTSLGQVASPVSEQVAVTEAAKQNAAKKSSSAGLISPNTSTGGSDSSSCSWLSMTTTVSVARNGEFLTKNSWSWLTNPVWTLTDVVGIGHDSSTAVDSATGYGLYYTYDEYYSDGTGFVGTFTDTYGSANTKSAGGWAWQYDIYGTDNGNYVENDRGYAFYYLNATPTSYSGQSDAYGQYAHEQNNPGMSIGVSLSGASFSVSPSFAFDNAPNTQAIFQIN